MKANWKWALLLVAAIAIVACKPKPEPLPEDDSIKVNITEGVMFFDYVASQHWWEIFAEDANFAVDLSNGTDVNQIAGDYDVATQMDPDYCNIVLKASSDTLNFTEGTLTLAVNGTSVTATGKLKAEDGKIYSLNIVYNEPEAKQTVAIDIADGEVYDDYLADYGVFVVSGTADDGSYVQFELWADAIVGTFTEADLDNVLVGSGLMIGGELQTIYSATITITETTEVYIVTASVLCYNNTLYNITLTAEKSAVDDGGDDDDDSNGIPARRIAKIVKKARK